MLGRAEQVQGLRLLISMGILQLSLEGGKYHEEYLKSYVTVQLLVRKLIISSFMSNENSVSVQSPVYYLVRLCICYLESLKFPSNIFCGMSSAFLSFAFSMFQTANVFPHSNSFNSFNILGLKKPTQKPLLLSPHQLK